MKTHIPGEPGRTLCGKSVSDYWYESDAMSRNAERAVPLKLIGKNELVDSATCKSCQRTDDARQVRDYLRQCKEAGLDPATGKP